MIINSNCLLARRLPKKCKADEQEVFKAIDFVHWADHTQVFEEELHQLILPPLIELNNWENKIISIASSFYQLRKYLASHNLEHEHLRLKTRWIFRLRVCLVSFTSTFIAIQNLIIICRLAVLFNFVHQNILKNSFFDFVMQGELVGSLCRT